MEWDKSYSATWRVYRVNRDTWADDSMLSDVDNVSITKTADGKLLESGNIETSGDFTSDYYRIVMIAEQGGTAERVDVATLLFDVAQSELDYGRTVSSASGYSVLYPASTTVITTGEYAPKGVDGVQYVKELLEDSINAPVETEGSFTLNDHLVHELGSSVLDAVWDVLDAATDPKFIMQIDGRGVVHIRPMPSEPDLIIDNSKKRLLLNGIESQTDVSNIPNRYIVMSDNIITIASNNNSRSPVSIASRGYKVDLVDTSPTPVNGQTRAEYANAKLEELSVMKETMSYEREYSDGESDGVYPYSLIRASINGLEGDLRVESQSINCGNGITISESASKETKLWERTL